MDTIGPWRRTQRASRLHSYGAPLVRPFSIPLAPSTTDENLMAPLLASIDAR